MSSRRVVTDLHSPSSPSSPIASAQPSQAATTGPPQTRRPSAPGSNNLQNLINIIHDYDRAIHTAELAVDLPTTSLARLLRSRSSFGHTVIQELYEQNLRCDAYADRLEHPAIAPRP